MTDSDTRVTLCSSPNMLRIAQHDDDALDALLGALRVDTIGRLRKAEDLGLVSGGRWEALCRAADLMADWTAGQLSDPHASEDRRTARYVLALISPSVPDEDLPWEGRQLLPRLSADEVAALLAGRGDEPSVPELRRLLAALRHGMGVREAAPAFGMSPGAIVRFAMWADVVGMRQQVVRRAAQDAVRAGRSVREAAKEAGVSRMTMQKYMTQAREDLPSW